MIFKTIECQGWTHRQLCVKQVPSLLYLLHPPDLLIWGNLSPRCCPAPLPVCAEGSVVVPGHLCLSSCVLPVSSGNTVLLRVLPAVYDMQPQPINNHLSELLALLAQLEQSEQYHLLRLLPQAAKKKQEEVSYMHWQRPSQR